MLFQRKIDRALNLLKEKNSKRNGKDAGNKDIAEGAYDESRPELEKNDVAAMIIAALLVFAPILIILAIILLIVVF